ncbi:MAG: DedA family protein [Desulfitobacteriaceae bacterium]|nr:DedA family protein [Desulfitobacteriaceae bacterium]MDD4753336.1 DedA family protein [Desulfitobacteriaceae bacterium]
MIVGDIDLARIIPLAAQWGYLGAAGVLFIEGLSILPFPGGTFLIIYGFLASQGKISLTLAIISASLGYTIAGTLPYWIGKAGGRTLLLNYGRYVGITHNRFRSTEKWFERFGIPLVAFGRLMFFRNYISYFAGIAKMPASRFYFYTWMGIIPWVIYMTLLGYILGNKWRYALELAERYSWVGAGTIAGLIILIYFFFKSRLWKRLNRWLDKE